MSATLSFDWLTVAAIGGAGGVGALVRFGAQKVWPNRTGRIPASVLVVNVLGSLIAGLSAGLFLNEPSTLGVVIIAGFCGGLTTFSTFAVESVQLASARARRQAALDIVLNVSLGVAGAGIGLWVATVFA